MKSALSALVLTIVLVSMSGARATVSPADGESVSRVPVPSLGKGGSLDAITAAGKGDPSAGAAPTFSPPTHLPDTRPPGEREPLTGFLAVVSIGVAAVAGWYVYRVIRKGL